MDDLEVRIPKEITEYHEKFYGLTIRQIIAVVAIAAINMPLYIYLSNIVGSDAAQYPVIIIAGIIGFFGFIKIHNLDAEKIIPYWFRNYFSFSKPLVYKTEKEILAEKEAKKTKGKKQKNKVTNKKMEHASQQNIEEVSDISDKEQKRLEKQRTKELKKQQKLEAKRIIREDREHKKQIKAKKKAQRELEEARRMFGVVDETKTHNSGLNEEDLAVIKELAQAFRKEKKNVQAEENETGE